MTFEEVIEEHRKAIGAIKVHISLGPNATPENLREELKIQREQVKEWESIPEIYRLKAQIYRLRKLLRQIGNLSCYDIIDLVNGDISQDTVDLKRELFDLTDLIPDVSSEDYQIAREYMNGERR